MIPRSPLQPLRRHATARDVCGSCSLDGVRLTQCGEAKVLASVSSNVRRYVSTNVRNMEQLAATCTVCDSHAVFVALVLSRGIVRTLRSYATRVAMARQIAERSSG